MSGLFLHHPSIGMAVLVNSGHVRARQRFSLAHEYAHALMDRNRVVGVSSADNSRERIEQRANAFAAAFLLPEAGLEEELRQLGKGQPARTDQIVFDVATGGSIQGQLRPAPRSQTIGFQDVAFIAHRFGVSYQAAVYRLKSLRYINQPESVLLLSSEQEEAGRDYLRALDLFDDLEEPVSGKRGTRELRGRVAHLALEAYRLGEISRGRLLDVGKTVGVDGRKLLELAEAARAE
jgi:Zn-dependent peptidase ImmA (M78 family)